MYTSLRIARTAEELHAVFRLRHQVFVEEERRFEHPSNAVFDLYDSFPETINVVASEDGTAIGAIRYVPDNPVRIPALDHYDFGPLMETLEGKFVSVGWFCAAREHRADPGLVFGLFKVAVRECRRLGLRHVIAPLHPGILPLLKSVGAQELGPEFHDEELNVPMVPIHVDMDKLPPGVKESMQDPLEMVLDEARERRIYRTGDAIIDEGDSGAEAFVVMRGAVRIVGLAGAGGKDRDVLLGPGQLFGELSLLDGGVRTNTVVCHSKETDVMVWDKDDFLRQIRTDAYKASSLCRVLASRLREQNRGGSDIPARIPLLARILIGASRNGEQPVNIKWLASQSALWPKELLTLLPDWEEKGWVVRNDDHLLLLDEEGLRTVITAE